jgi:histidyl-tRNA synthetase
LEYYTGIVFEAKDQAARAAPFGRGHYGKPVLSGR